MHVYSLISQRSGIEYLEKPVTFDEKNVACTLEAIIQSYRNRDSSSLAELIRDDAIFEIFLKQTYTGRVLTKREYMSEVVRPYIYSIRSIRFMGTLLRVKNKDKATVFFRRIVYFYRYKSPLISDGYLKFSKENKQWLITEANFQNAAPMP